MLANGSMTFNTVRVCKYGTTDVDIKGISVRENSTVGSFPLVSSVVFASSPLVPSVFSGFGRMEWVDDPKTGSLLVYEGHYVFDKKHGQGLTSFQLIWSVF